MDFPSFFPGFLCNLVAGNRVFLNLGFAKPMFCNPGLFTKTMGITKMTKTTQTTTPRGSVAGEAKSTETAEMTKTTGIWGAKPRFPKT